MSKTNKFSVKYKKEHCKRAFEILSSGPFKTKAHLCAEFGCTRQTIISWIKDHEDFREAFEAGINIGEKITRDKIEAYAWQPAAQVNNGLIKMLASNVYGIKEDQTPPVVVNNNINTDPEQLMKERGIPIPEIEVEDVPE